MFTDEQLKQLRGVMREEVESEAEETRRDAHLANLHLKAELSAIKDRLKTVEIDTKKTRETVIALDQKFDASHVDMGGLLHEILDTVSDHHTKLAHRVERIEGHLGLPKPE